MSRIAVYLRRRLHYFVFISHVIFCCLSLEICACVCPWDCLCLHLSLCHFAFLFPCPLSSVRAPPPFHPPPPPLRWWMDSLRISNLPSLLMRLGAWMLLQAGEREEGWREGWRERRGVERNEARTRWCRGHGIWKTSKWKRMRQP